MEGMLAFGLMLSVVDKFTTPMRKATEQLDMFASSLKRAEKLKLPDMIARVKGIEQLAAWGKKVSDSSKGIMAIGAIATAAGARMRGIASDFAAPLHELEQSLTAVKTIAPGTFGSAQADMVALKKAAQDWSLAHSDSAGDFTKATYMMVSSGLDMKQAIEGTSAAMLTARATMGDAMETASTLATFYANFGNRAADTTTEMQRLGDVMARTQQLFKFANLGQLTEGMKYGMSVARQFGISEYQLAAALGTLADAGFEGGMAGTSFAATMRQMLKASKDLGFEIARTSTGGVDFVGTIENIRAQFGDQLMLPKVQRAFQEAFGDEGLRGVMALIDKIPRMKGAMGDLQKSLGTAGKAAAEMEGTGGAAWQRFQNTMDALKVSLAEGLAPTLTSLSNTLKGVMEWMRGFSEAHPWVAKLAGYGFLAVTAILSLLGPLVLVFGALKWTFGQGIILVARFRKAVLWLEAGGLAKLGSTAVWVGRALLWLARGALLPLRFTLLKVIPAVLSLTLALLTNPFFLIGVAIGVVVVALVALVRHWDAIVTWLKGAWAATAAFFTTLWTDIVNTFWAAVGGIKAALVAAWDWVVGVFTGIWEWITGLPGRFFDAGKALLTALWNGMKSVPVFKQVLWLFGKLRDLMPHSDAKWGPLSHLTASGRAFVATWAKGMEGALPRLEGAMGGFLDQLEVKVPEIPPLRVALAGAGGPTGGGGKQVTIHGGITIHVNASDVRDQENFVRMLKGLAEQYG